MKMNVSPQAKNILISMGGVDKNNATGKILEAILDCSLPLDIRITVVMGLHAPWIKEIQSLAELNPHQIDVKVNVKNMAELMVESDFAIGAAGSTSWERCCLGLPSIIVVLAENQLQGALALEQNGSAKVIYSIVDIKIKLGVLLNSFFSVDTLKQLI
jgi:spore coat polysaccharide biosynthesis predicted glycosyltransferase SpsG